MARITAGGGPSFNDHELNDPDPPLVIRRFMLGDDDVSLGDNSPPSGQSESWSNAGATADSQSPARTTENPSDNPPTEAANFTAPMTGGDGPETEQPSSDEVPPYEEWTVAELKDECHKRGLPVSGTKAELADRLYDNDELEAAKAEDEANNE